MNNKIKNCMKLSILILVLFCSGCNNRKKYQDVFVKEDFRDIELQKLKTTTCSIVDVKNYNGFGIDDCCLAVNNAVNINFSKKSQNIPAKWIYKLYKKNNVVPIVVDNDNIYYLDQYSKLICMDKKNYKEKWNISVFKSKKDFKAWISADFKKNTIIAVNDSGQIVNIDTKNKKIRWTQSINIPLHGCASIMEDKVIVYRCDNAISAYNINNGQHIWSMDKLSSDIVFTDSGNFAHFDKKILCAYSTGECSLVNVDQGEEYWNNVVTALRAESAIDLYGVITAKPLIHSDKAIISNSRGNTTAFDIETGLAIWTNDIGSKRSMCICKNWIFSVDKNNNLVCMSSKTGRIKYSVDICDEIKRNIRITPIDQKFAMHKDSYFSNVLVVNGKLMVANGSGALLFFNINNGSLENIVTYTSVTDFVPVHVFIEDKTIYILSNDSRLYVVK